jgi:hypothetical protein
MVAMAVTLIGIGRNASSVKLFEKACRDVKIGVRNFHIYQSRQTPL